MLEVEAKKLTPKIGSVLIPSQKTTSRLAKTTQAAPLPSPTTRRSCLSGNFTTRGRRQLMEGLIGILGVQKLHPQTPPNR